MVTSSHVRQFLHHVLPAVIRPLRVAWNQIIGFFFLVLGVWAIPHTVRSARAFDGSAEQLFRLVVSGIFIAFMLGFGIQSFWRARKVPKLR
jgi:hypothetical protein